MTQSIKTLIEKLEKAKLLRKKAFRDRQVANRRRSAAIKIFEKANDKYVEADAIVADLEADLAALKSRAALGEKQP